MMSKRGDKKRFDNLDDRSKLFLLDYAFNLGVGDEDLQTGERTGLTAFPKMIDAVLSGDWETVNSVNPDVSGPKRKEYERVFTNDVGDTKLLGRNDDIYDYFIEPKLSAPKQITWGSVLPGDHYEVDEGQGLKFYKWGTGPYAKEFENY